VVIFFEFMPLVNCPTCEKLIEYSGNEFRPFCSERCKLLDFGAWADGEFAIPDNSSLLSEEDLIQIENSLEEGS
jgi:uncharacterized protein